MSYRDDREALKAHAATLEQELSVARAEIERLRHGESEQELLPLRPTGGSVAAALGLMLVALGVAEPLPIVVRLASIATSILLLLSAVFVGRLIVLARPNELVVLAGRTIRKRRAGRALRMPLVQTASVLDLGVFRVASTIERARTKDGIDVALDLIGHARVSPAEDALDRAVSRLLGAPRETQIELVRTALDQAARGLTGELERRELEQQRAKAARAIRELADSELEAQGLVLVAVYVLDVRSDGGNK